MVEALPTQREIDLSPNQRYALIGKTRSGKTTFGMALASMLVPYNRKKAQGWEVWWIDTKGDAKDIAALFEWGFKIPSSGFLNRGKARKNEPTRKLIPLRNDPRDRKNRRLAWQKAQDIFSEAFDQRGVVVVVDEYVQVVQSERNAGEDLLNIFQRGGGLDVGLIGMTQEPVYVPRQLISQSSHQFLFNVSYQHDVDYLTRMFADYEKPLDRGHAHGFFHVATDYDGKGVYYPNQFEWANQTGLIKKAA